MGGCGRGETVRVMFLVAGLLAVAGNCTPATGSQAIPPCGWPVVTTSAAAGDTAAIYWLTPIPMGPETRVVISGAFPHARYFSVQTYTLSDGFTTTVDARLDRDIPAVAGQNPYLGQHGSTADSYELVMRAHSRAPGEISGLPPGTDVGISWVMLRIYLPDNPTEPTGGVPLPTLAVTHRDGAPAATVEPCASSDPDSWGNPDVESVADPFVTSPDAAQPATPFALPPSSLTRFPNADNRYLAAPLRWGPGRVAVVEFRAPSTPDTRSGESPGLERDLRYWSVCVSSVPTLQTVQCLSDHETVVDPDGNVRVFISASADRPVGASNWLPWGPIPNAGVAVRHMIPSAAFGQSIHEVDGGEDPFDVMGAFAPSLRYCSNGCS